MEIRNCFYQLSEDEVFLCNGGANAGLIVGGVFTFLGGLVVSCSGAGAAAGVCGMAAGVVTVAAGIAY